MPGSSAAAPQDTQSGCGEDGGDTRPNSQGTATGKSQRGRGFPPRDGDAPVEKETSIPTRRRLPNREIKTVEKIGSIRDAAKDTSRSTGKQSADVFDSSSRYSSSYLSGRSVKGKEDEKKQQVEVAAKDIGTEGTVSQHESVALSEEEQRQSRNKRPRLSGGRVSEVVSIPMEYGDGYDLNGYAALYSGRIKNDKPDGQGKLLFKGVVLYGCGDEKYDVTIDGTFHEGCSPAARPWRMSVITTEIIISCTRATTNAWK